ncbi:hypothetical protein OAJ67_03265 [Candidatus Nitrosopelagicus sp.]|nr:hypothetical protein [Candidatus Nitrosopelagicus sp.]
MIRISLFIILVVGGGSIYQAHGETIEDIINNNELVNILEFNDNYKVEIIQIVRDSQGRLISTTSNVYTGIIPSETLQKSLDAIYEDKKILLFPWLGIEEFQTVSYSKKDIVKNENGSYERWRFVIEYEEMQRTFYSNVGIFEKFETSNRIYVIKLLDAQLPASLVETGDITTWIFEIQKKVV